MNDPHLTPDIIARAATRRLAASERSALEAHVAACNGCRADLSYAIRFERRGRRKRAAGAGLIVLAGALGVTLFPRDAPVAPPPDLVRSAAEEGVRTIVAVTPADGATVSGDSVRFSWHAIAPDVHYRFQLSSSEGAPLLERAGRDTTVYVALTPRLEPGGTYLWFVDAVLPDGVSARSRVRSFTMRE